MPANRPDWVIMAAFNADPNDPADIPIWTPITDGVLLASMISRGKQYELGQSQTAQPTVLLRDLDEYYNAANPSSPYSPNILPYRQILWQGVWPNAGTGNLINTLGFRVRPDPTFESYTAGSAPTPAWTAGVGNTSPIIADART